VLNLKKGNCLNPFKVFIILVDNRRLNCQKMLLVMEAFKNIEHRGLNAGAIST
jgi:hypothetical protein